MFRDLLDMVYPEPSKCVFCGGPGLGRELSFCSDCLRRLNLRWISRRLGDYLIFSLSNNERIVAGRVSYQHLRVWGYLLGLALKEEPAVQECDYLVLVPVYPGPDSARQWFATGVRHMWKRPIFGEIGCTSRDELIIANPDKLRGKTMLLVDLAITPQFYRLARLIQRCSARVQAAFVVLNRI